MVWVIAAVAAVGVTTAAVTVANATSGQDDVLSQDEVSRQLGEQTPRPPAADPTGTPEQPAATGTPDPAGAGQVRTLRRDAAQVVVRCQDGRAYLESWSPNPGYRVDEVVRGPAAEAYLWIESDSFEDVEFFIRCQAGEPVLTERVEQDDHGDDDDDDDRGDRDDDDDRGDRDDG
jgi:hypothetical protein